MIKVLKQKKGITLIALVITIIVLLILAGISISMLSGDNSILQKATEAKTDTDNVQIKERIQLAELSARTDGKGNLTYSKLNEELTKEFGEKGIGYIISDESDEIWTIKVKNVEYDIIHEIKPIHADLLTINGASEVNIGENIQLNVITEPETITDTITWSSSDETKAIVDSTGLVTGVSDGTIVITAIAKDSYGIIQKTANHNIEVKAPRTDGWSLIDNDSDSNVSIGDLLTPNNNDIKNEKFYVLNVSGEKVTLLAEKCINTTTNKQDDNPSNVPFDNETSRTN